MSDVVWMNKEKKYKSKDEIVYAVKGLLNEDELFTLRQSLMDVDTNINMSDVILSNENTEKFQQFIREQKNKEKLIEAGLMPMNRILMFGATGTGKTYSTKALSNLLGYTMLYVDIAKALESNDVAKNVAVIFTVANHLKECLIMLDECDAVAWNRDLTTGGEEQTKARRATNSIFQQLDQMDSSNVFIAATNLAHKLDPAFKRRFDMQMFFQKPNMDIDDALLHFLHKDKFKYIDDVETNIRDIAKRRANSKISTLSYDELQIIVEIAMKEAVLDGTYEVRSSRLYNELSNRLGLNHTSGSKTVEQKALWQ